GQQSQGVAWWRVTRKGRAEAARSGGVERHEHPAAPSRSTRRISDPNANARPTEADELGEMPRAIAAMLLGTAYLAAIVGFSGVMYLRGLALVYADIIQYPILLGAMVVLACLLVPLSRTVF